MKVKIRLYGDFLKYGPEERYITLPETSKEKEIHKIVKKFFKAFEEPFVVQDHKIYVNLSIGGVIFPDDGIDIVTLLRKADRAMYNVKAQGESGYQRYQSDLPLKAK